MWLQNGFCKSDKRDTIKYKKVHIYAWLCKSTIVWLFEKIRSLSRTWEEFNLLYERLHLKKLSKHFWLLSTAAVK